MPQGFTWEDVIAKAEAPSYWPKDIYDCTAVYVEPTVSKSIINGTNYPKPQIHIRYRVDSSDELGNKLIFDWLTLSPESQFAIKQFMRAMKGLGVDMDWFRQSDPEFDKIAQEIVGAKVRLRVTVDEDRGLNNVEEYLKYLGHDDTVENQWTPAAETEMPDPDSEVPF